MADRHISEIAPLIKQVIGERLEEDARGGAHVLRYGEYLPAIFAACSEFESILFALERMRQALVRIKIEAETTESPESLIDIAKWAEAALD